MKKLIILLLFVCGCGGVGLRSPVYIKFPNAAAAAAQKENWDVLSLLAEPDRTEAVKKVINAKTYAIERAADAEIQKPIISSLVIYNGLALLCVAAGVAFKLACPRSKWGVPLIGAGAAVLILVNVLGRLGGLIAYISLAAFLAILIFKTWDYVTERNAERDKNEQDHQPLEKEKI